MGLEIEKQTTTLELPSEVAVLRVWFSVIGVDIDFTSPSVIPSIWNKYIIFRSTLQGIASIVKSFFKNQLSVMRLYTPAILHASIF
jgi:hypothetical protein